MEEGITSATAAMPLSPGINPNNEKQMLELKAVIDSISQGKAKMFKKAKFQAFSAAISHEDHVIKVQDHLGIIKNKCTNAIVAYRVIDSNSNTGISEGFDDDGEEGSGEKLLRLLQKMGIENIMVVVCVWHNNMPGHYGTDFYRMVLERARDLLTALHKEVLQQENEDAIVAYENDNIMGSQRGTQKQIVESKVYNMAEAVKIGMSKDQNHTASPDIHRKYVEEQTIDSLPKVDQEEYKASIMNLEKVGRSIEKSHIRDFLSFVRPEPVISKLFQILAIIKGFKNPNWVKIRDMISNPTFRLELMSFKGHEYDSENVLKAFKIFESSVASMSQNSPRRKEQDYYAKFYEILPKISEGSVHIFDWIISFFKAYSGYSNFGNIGDNIPQITEEPEEITLRTKMKVRQEAIKAKSKNLSKKSNPIKVPTQVDFVSPEAKADKEYFKDTEEANANSTDDGGKNAKQKNSKKANIGIFLQNKQMKFGDDALVPEDGGKPTLIDYNAFKRGGNFMIDEEEELRKRELEEQEKQDRK